MLVAVVTLTMARPVVAAPVAASGAGAVALGVRADCGGRLGRSGTFSVVVVRERDG
ncbi:MAG TPA: hypothetical protein VMP41_00305 [Acidimicrobiales bacterium]|nr:hypothetical protein [Acidimicrobiales bacterium]